MDWLGWHEQGDGKLFLGIKVEQGRIKDFADGPKLKTALRKIVDDYSYTMMMGAQQSIIFRDIEPKDKNVIEGILAAHGIQAVENFDLITRNAMACPALPLCGLAVTEAERIMPSISRRLHSLLDSMGLGNEQILIRMTGCPTGCARPYMGEIAFVGDGPQSYQIWLGGSHALTRTAHAYEDKVHLEQNLEDYFRPIFSYFKSERKGSESFGDFVQRVGFEKIKAKQTANA